jgi:hypothetical protein
VINIINNPNVNQSINNTEDELIINSAKKNNADELVLFELKEINYFPAKITSESYDRSKEIIEYNLIKDIIDLATKEKAEDNSKKITVRATLTKNKLITSVRIEDIVIIFEIQKANLIDKKNINKTEDFASEWGSYSGDSRALEPSDLNLCSKSSPEIPDKYKLISSAFEKIGFDYNKFFLFYNNIDTADINIKK